MSSPLTRARKQSRKFVRRIGRGLRTRSKLGPHNAPPDFIVVGIQKAGTNASRHALNQHPQIHVVLDELHYFDKRYGLPLRWYQNHFVNKAGLLNGEATPLYMPKKLAIDRIQRHYPGVKLIAFLREPVQRAFSKWNRIRSRNDQASVATKSFAQSVLDDDRNLLTNGLYADQLEYILERFPRQNLHIAVSEQVLAQPNEEYDRIVRFLDLPPFSFDAAKRRHPTRYLAELQLADIERLFPVYAESNERLYKLLGDPIPEWSEFYRGHGLI